MPGGAEQSVDARNTGGRDGAPEAHVGGQLVIDGANVERSPNGVGRRDDGCCDTGGKFCGYLDPLPRPGTPPGP